MWISIIYIIHTKLNSIFTSYISAVKKEIISDQWCCNSFKILSPKDFGILKICIFLQKKHISFKILHLKSKYLFMIPKHKLTEIIKNRFSNNFTKWKYMTSLLCRNCTWVWFLLILFPVILCNKLLNISPVI